ncbi:hypothetical protein MKK75_05185 [Methylobacterium sp. J-030]|uniref:hypothetical protein n=1 Tax=Methylobacterium sp. J-030 TaxID=2836627 RepID=UPI001FBA34E0|nr:hypothetical protein [Methylobacterium sp. J-030]MCJ2068208.1 hypothetical protein [Methylobacterium sp. J-030]
MSSFAAAKQRYAVRQDEARRLASRNLQGPLGVTFHLTAWGERARHAYETQWLSAARHPDAGWDWPEIHRRNRNEPDALSLAIWVGDDRLCGLGFAVPSSRAVTLRFLEGDPRPDCPLIGRRALIALEASALYAQGIGRSQIRVEPANETLAALYRDRYGFALVSLEGAPAYYVRNIL